MLRDVVLFTVGMVGIAVCVLIPGNQQPVLLVIFGAMVGLPAHLHASDPPRPAPPRPDYARIAELERQIYGRTLS